MLATNCFNCGTPLAKCQCGDTETYENDDGPTCPWCGELNQASESEGTLYSEATVEWECDDCGKTFAVSVGVSFSWAAKKP